MHTRNCILACLGRFPEKDRFTINEIKMCIRDRDAGVRGIKLHPAYQGFAADDRKLYPIYARCAELSLPIVFHAGWDIAFPDAYCSEPDQCERIVRDFPECRFVFAHMGGMMRWDEVARRLCGKDVYLDLAFVREAMTKEQLQRLLGLHDPRRILFATDCPWSCLLYTS